MKRLFSLVAVMTAVMVSGLPAQAQFLEYGPNGAELVPMAADQVAAGNHTGTDVEAKTVVGTGGITVTGAAGTLTISGAAVVGTNPGTGFTASNKSASFNAAVNNCYFVSDNATATLPTAVSVAGKQILIIHVGSGKTTTMASTSAQTINGAAAGSTTCTTQWESMLFTSDGSNWTATKSLTP